MNHDISLVQIETTTSCPAHCPMCPRNLASRPHGIMPTDTFYKVVEEAVGLGANVISPLINGEPLADPRMVGFVQWISDRFPTIQVGWFTNAALLGDREIAGLLSAGNIHTFNVSMQGGTKEVYERNTGLDFNRTVEALRKLVKYRDKIGSNCVIRVVMCLFSATIGTEDGLVRIGVDVGCDVRTSYFSNFGGLVHDEQGERPTKNLPRQVCDRALHHLYVFWNGDVGQCCFDLRGETIYGNVNKKPLAEILASDQHQEMVRAHTALDLDQLPPVCRNCNSAHFHG